MSRAEQPLKFPNVNDAYQSAFLRRCHEIIARGYAQLPKSEFASAQEPEITGELVRSMREVVEAPDAPEWMVHFAIADDPPVNNGARLGKKRRRVDIEIFRAERGPRPRLHYEAKRLHRSGSTAEYLGSEGLGLFVVGAYGADQEHGGMLGYMQEHNAAIWQEKIARGFRIGRAKLRMLKGGEYSAKTIISEPTGVHTSRHRRRNLPDITIHHTLLDFSSPT